MKRFICVLFVVLPACILFLTGGCSNDSGPIFTTIVEPRYIDLNDIPPYITFTVKSNVRWRSNNGITIERYDNGDWLNVYRVEPYGFGDGIRAMCPDEDVPPPVWIIPTYPYSHYSPHYFDASIAGRYRIVVYRADQELLYSEFTIFDGDDDASS